MQKLLVATTNKGKFAEIEEILRGVELNLVFLGDLEIDRDVDENGESFEENALLKARFFSDLLGMPAIADDSGIFINALAGELGVKTRRWGAGADATDEEWIEFFLKRMEGVEDRKAKFVAAVAVVWPIVGGGVVEDVFVGETSGVITAELEAPIRAGIPLSSCFRSDGSEKVYAALDEDEKNRGSHRGKAMVKVKDFLKEFLA